jgi:hypothetical protein
MSRRDEATALSAEERALLQVAHEERHLPGPGLDGEIIESRVLRKIAAEVPPKRRSPRWSVPVAAALLVAAGIAVTVGLRHEGKSPVSSSNASEARPVAGEKLVLGQSISASEKPVTVEHAGHARWTLAPGSQATLERRDSVVIVRLLSGSLEADVEPRPVPETFVVEAGSVRAAVHGTHFIVKYEPAGVFVNVTEGVVLVTRDGTSESTPLRAPASQSFALGASAPSSTAGARRSASPPTVPHAGARQPAHAPAPSGAALPDEPSISAVETGVSEVVSAVQRCFAESSASGSDVQVSVRSTVSFQVLPNGELSGIRFEPPLSPNATACARDALGGVRFSESRQGIALSRVLELKR